MKQGRVFPTGKKFYQTLLIIKTSLATYLFLDTNIKALYLIKDLIH